MKRYLWALMLSACVPFAACDTNDDPVDRATASNISTAIMMSVNRAVEEAEANAGARCAVPQDLDIYYISGGVSVTGTKDWDETTSTFTYDLVITFTDFACGTGTGVYLINGSTTMSGTCVFSENFSKNFDFSGSFAVDYGDGTCDMSWNVHFACDYTGIAYSGTYEINGDEFDFEYALTV